MQTPRVQPIALSDNPRTAHWLSGTAGFLALLGACLLVFFWDLSRGQMEQTDCWVGQTARELQVNLLRAEDAGSGEDLRWIAWAVPMFSGELRLNKFPLPYWQLVAASNLLGRPIDEALVRAAGSVHALLLVLLLYAVAHRAFGPAVALYTGAVGLGSVFLLDWSHRGASDLQVSFWCCLSLFALWRAMHSTATRRWMALAYVAAGVGMLSKGPVPMVVIGAPGLVYVLLLLLVPGVMGAGHLPQSLGRRALHLLGRLHLWWGLPLFLLVWVPWIVVLIAGVARIEHPDQLAQPADGLPFVSRGWEMAAGDVWARWKTEFVDRATGELTNVQKEQFWPLWMHVGFYPMFTLGYLAPWTLSVLPALLWPLLPPARRDRSLLLFCLIYYVAVTAFFAWSHGKEGRYTVLMLPPVIVLLGHHLHWAFARSGLGRLTWPERITAWAAAVAVPVVCIAAWFWIEGHTAAGLIEALGIRYTGATLFAQQHAGVVAGVTAILLVAAIGYVAAAVFLLRARRQTCFGLIVATTALTYLTYHHTLDELLRTRDQAAVYAFSAELAELIELDPASVPPFPSDYRNARFRLRTAHPDAPQAAVDLFFSDNRDARIIWATGLPIPRVVSQLERDRLNAVFAAEDLSPIDRAIRTQQSFVQAAFERLGGPNLTLVISEEHPLPRDGRPTLRDRFLMGLILAELDRLDARGQQVWLWAEQSWGRSTGRDFRLSLLANRPPPAGQGPADRPPPVMNRDSLNVPPDFQPASADELRQRAAAVLSGGQ